MSFDAIVEKLIAILPSLGPAAILFAIAAHEVWLYIDPNSTGGDVGKAFWFACAGSAWLVIFKHLSDLWNDIWQSRRTSVANSIVNRIEKIYQVLRWKLSSFDQRYLDCLVNDCCDDYRVEGYQQPFGIKMLMLQEVFVPLELVDHPVQDLATKMVPDQQSKRNQQQRKLIQLQKLIQPPYSSSEAAAEYQKLISDYLDEQVAKQIAREKRKNIWELLALTPTMPLYRRMVILAAVGYGKTTLLKHITLSYAKKLPLVRESKAPKLIPILLYLRDMKEIFTKEKETFPSLPDLIHNHHLPNLPPPNYGQLEVPEHWAANLLQSGRALVMLDGFDEVAENRREDVSTWINQHIRRYPRSVFILTSRPSAYNTHYTAEKLETTLYVRAFNDQQRAAFIHKWYSCQERADRNGRDTPDVRAIAEDRANKLQQQLEQHPKLLEMVGNPLLLNMIATFHRTHPGDELPKYRAELYADICKLQLEDRPRAKGITMLLNCKQSLKLLQVIAFNLMHSPGGRLTSVAGTQLQAWIRQPLLSLNHVVKPEQWLEQIVAVSELLVKKEEKGNDTDSIYKFAHLSFQEYLAALQIETVPSLRSLLLEKFEETEWRETVLLYAAQTTNPTSLIQEACRRNTRTALQLGYDCVRESPNPIDPDAFQTFQSLRYHDLETYLSQEQWGDADQETYRLMIATVGKEEGQWLDLADFENFPCNDLWTIDQLWVNYSNGKFGFSVQKRIWQECGSPMTYNDDWEKFGDRVGWRKGGKWLTREEYSYSNSPAIKLPLNYLFVLLWYAGFEGFGDETVESLFCLFSRIQTCEV